MKKLLVLLSVFLVFFGLGMQAAGAEEVLESSYSTPAETMVSIIPTIQITEPGTIAVKISWTAPQLAFIRKVRAVDNLGYYALQSNVRVPFTVTNNSRPSSSGAFNGSVRVRAEKPDTLSDGTAAQRKNISILLTNEAIDTLAPLAQGAVDSDSFTLNYTNREESYMSNLTNYPASVMLLDTMSEQDIVKNMTVAVRFIISAAK